MSKLSDELRRIQELQRRSLRGIDQVQAHHIVLQNQVDKLLLRLSDLSEVAYDVEISPQHPPKAVVEEAVLDVKLGTQAEAPLQTQVAGQIPSESPTISLSPKEATGKEFKHLRTIGGYNKEKNLLDTLEQEGLLEDSFLQRLRKKASDPFEKSQVVQFCRRVVRHPAFEPIICLIILSNLVIQGFEIEHSLLPEPKSEWPIGVEICFLSFYVVELILRILAYGPAGFTDLWFLMDLIIIISSIVGLVLYSTNNFSSFLVIHGFRLLRLGRSLKGVNRFRIVWHLLHGLLNSGQVLLATFSLLVLAIYIAACIGVEIITKDATLVNNPQVSSIVSNSFGSLRVTMLTLLQFLTLDSIYQIYIPLVIEKPGLMLYFLAIILILPITLMNLVTAVLVENGMTAAQKEAEFETKARSDEMKSAVLQLLDIFTKLDINHNGALTRSELVKMPANAIPRGLLDALAVEDLTDLFDVLDVDRTGEISQQEFVDGVLQMVVRDVPAETMRLMKLLQSVHRAVHFMNDSHCRLLSNANVTSLL